MLTFVANQEKILPATVSEQWLAMARTILHEELHFDPAVIEHQLAHSVPDALVTAYNRTKFLKERRLMMQTWADYMDKLKAGAEIIPLKDISA